MINGPYPRTLERLTILHIFYKGSTFASECWSSLGLNLPHSSLALDPAT